MDLPPAVAQRLAALLGVQPGQVQAAPTTAQDVADALALAPSSLPSASYSNRPPTNIGTSQVQDGAITPAKMSAAARLNRWCGSWLFATTSTTTYYLAPGASTPGNATPGNTETVCRASMSAAITLKRLRVKATGALTAANSLVITVRKNGVATALTITLDSASVAGTVYSSVADVAIAADDEVSIEVSATGASGTNKFFGYVIDYEV